MLSVSFTANDRTNPLPVILLPALPAIIHRHSLIHAIPAWYPLFNSMPILLILGIIFTGNRVSQLSRIRPQVFAYPS
jgi:hypothetical protein